VSFAEKVYQLVKQIPKGKVTTYGQVALGLGCPQASRAVGNALHVNPYQSVPCHRVVNRQGQVALNFGGGDWRDQRRKLLQEGVQFKDEKYVDLEKCGWFDLT
jgi:methylated-DNA-protein-cysteine methyltransferase-like protein